MPQSRQEGVWLYVSIKEEQDAYLDADNGGVHNLAISHQVPLGRRLQNGLCVGLCIQWFRRVFDCPDDTILNRMCHICSTLDRAALSQYRYYDILEPYEGKIGTCERDAKFYTAACRVSRLRFDFLLRVDFTDDRGFDAAIAQILASIQPQTLYFIDSYGKRYDDADKYVGGSFHVLALYYNPAGLSLLFDSNYGEFILPPHSFGRFLVDLDARSAKEGVTLTSSYSSK